MRLILLITSLMTSIMSFQCFANSASNSDKLQYANIYAENLIEEFDRELDERMNQQFLFSDNILFSRIYAKLLSARRFIEAFGHSNLFDHRVGNSKLKLVDSLLMIQDSKAYAEVVKEIDGDAEIIFEYRQKELIKNKGQKALIYPSTTWDGNVSGSKFPKRVWSLTFDDGPKKDSTQVVVDNLYRHGMKATFFMMVKNAKNAVESAEYVRDAGMEVALHSYTHKSLNKVSTTRLDYEVTQAKKDLEDLLSVELELFRLPYGAGLRDTKVRAKIANNKMIHVFWNVDTLDWKDKNPESIKARTLKQMRLSRNDAGIILFHDIHKQTLKASEMVMQHLNDNNYQVCTIGEVINYKNGTSQDCLN